VSQAVDVTRLSFFDALGQNRSAAAHVGPGRLIRKCPLQRRRSGALDDAYGRKADVKGFGRKLLGRGGDGLAEGSRSYLPLLVDHCSSHSSKAIQKPCSETAVILRGGY
jgi:hypothetical protein